MTASTSVVLNERAQAELKSLLSGFEHAPEGVRQCLANSLRSLLAGLAYCDLTLAPIAGQDVFRLEFSAGWMSELRAAAAHASQCDSFCAHGGPHAK